MRKNRRRTLLAMAPGAVVVVGVLCSVTWRSLFGDKQLARITLSSGDTIVIRYRPAERLSSALLGTGGLRYHIYSEQGKTCGWLTLENHFDAVSDVNLQYDVLGPRSATVSARGFAGWVFSGDSTGTYGITDLSGRSPARADEE